MILGVAARHDADAATIVERVRGDASISVSIADGVALAAWPGACPDAVFADDHVHVGALSDGIPTPSRALRGDFACIARVGRSLRLARGRFAGRPLFWASWRGATVACSRVAPLIELLGADAQLNVDHVVAMFDMNLWLMAPLPFEPLRRVAMNTVVDVDGAGSSRAVRGALDFEPELRAGARDLARQLREQFDAAVARQSAGARTVGVFAGGGVDSSNLLSAAVRNSRSRSGMPAVLPITFEYGGSGDDRPHMAALTRHLQIEPLRLQPAEGAAYRGRDHVIDGMAHATAPGGAMIAALQRSRALGASITLVGEGAELLLNSDGAVFADFMMHSPLRALRSAWRFRDLGHSRARTIRYLIAGPVARCVAPEWVRQRTQRARVAPPWAGRRLLAHFDRPARRPPDAPVCSQRDRVAALASSDLMSATREYMTRWEIASGTAIRFAYFDDEYVRFVARIPSAAIFSGDRERGLLRESMEGTVPDSVRYRMDKATPHLAFVELFQAMGGVAAVDDLVTVRELVRLGIVRERPFRAEFDRFARDPVSDHKGWSKFWRTLTAEAFLRWSPPTARGAA